jgi:hypothetical protein
MSRQSTLTPERVAQVQRQSEQFAKRPAVTVGAKYKVLAWL